MVKSILKHASIWVTIYWSITMLIFYLSAYFLCNHFGNNNNVLCVSLSLGTFIFSLFMGYISFINIYISDCYYFVCCNNRLGNNKELK